MLKRWVAATIRWAIGKDIATEIDEVRQALSEIEQHIAAEEIHDDFTVVLYWVSYSYTYVLPDQPANSRRMFGQGSFTITVDKGGLKTAAGMNQLHAHITEGLSKEHSFPIAQVCNILELNRWVRRVQPPDTTNG